MTLGARIREERLRLGKNQTDFAALAGASKRAMVSWEKDDSAPVSTALVAWAEAGADAVYILTGKRGRDARDQLSASLEEQLNDIERKLLNQGTVRLPDQTEAEAEWRAFSGALNRLNALMRYDRELMSPSVLERASTLLAIANDPDRLSSLRRAEFAQNRKKRDDLKADFAEYLEGAPYQPSGEVLNQLVMIALEYCVPAKLLAYLVWDVVFEAKGIPKIGTSSK